MRSGAKRNQRKAGEVGWRNAFYSSLVLTKLLAPTKCSSRAARLQPAGSKLTLMDKLSEKLEKPPSKVVLQRAFVYAVLAVWSLTLSAASGPAFQVAIGFGLSIYYLNMKRGGKKAMFGAPPPPPTAWGGHLAGGDI